MFRSPLVFAGTILAATAHSQPAPAQASCGATVTVQRSDTLSSIAERCEVSEAQILRSNPGIESSADLAAGDTLQVGGTSGSAASGVDRLGSAARQAGDALAGIARNFGSTVEEVLQKNPDLHQRLRGLGDRLNLPGVDKTKAQVTISPDTGTRDAVVTVSAVGLPNDTPVKVGCAAPNSAYEVVETARTSATGTLQVNVQASSCPSRGERIVFVVAGPDREWTLRSRPFRTTGTRL